jgi:hypothetical protein
MHKKGCIDGFLLPPSLSFLGMLLHAKLTHVNCHALNWNNSYTQTQDAIGQETLMIAVIPSGSFLLVRKALASALCGEGAVHSTLAWPLGTCHLIIELKHPQFRRVML